MRTELTGHCPPCCLGCRWRYWCGRCRCCWVKPSWWLLAASRDWCPALWWGCWCCWGPSTGWHCVLLQLNMFWSLICIWIFYKFQMRCVLCICKRVWYNQIVYCAYFVLWFFCTCKKLYLLFQGVSNDSDAAFEADWLHWVSGAHSGRAATG